MASITISVSSVCAVWHLKCKPLVVCTCLLIQIQLYWEYDLLDSSLIICIVDWRDSINNTVTIYICVYYIHTYIYTYTFIYYLLYWAKTSSHIQLSAWLDFFYWINTIFIHKLLISNLYVIKLMCIKCKSLTLAPYVGKCLNSPSFHAFFQPSIIPLTSLPSSPPSFFLNI